MAWNRPSGNPVQPKPKGFKGSRIVTLTIITACCLGSFLFFVINSVSSRQSEGVGRNMKSAIRTVEPSVTNAVSNLPVVPTLRVSKAETYIDERGIKRYKGGARVPDPNAEKRKPVSQPGHRVFHNYAESQIYSLLKVSPGSPLFVTRRFDERFLDSFKKSLTEKIEILDTDSPGDKIAKQTMIETKEDLKKRMEAGEDICAYLQEIYTEVQRLAKYKKDIEKMVREVMATKEDMNDHDFDDLIGAANKMLADQGLAPIRNRSFLKKKLSMQFKTKEGTSK